MDLATAQTEHNQGFQLHRRNRVREAEPFYHRAVAADPDFKEAWMNLGLAILSQGRPEEALSCQRQALQIDPASPDAHNNLGMVLYTQGHIAEAENAFRTAIRLQPNHANATLNLGSTRQVFNHIDEAETLFRRALTLGVDPARANSNLSLAVLAQARPEEAELCARQALALRPDYPEARINLALALLTMGRMNEGWREYECRWQVDGLGTAPVFAQPRWTGQPLHGETVLIYAEQGFGDTLQFCRYAPMVAAAGGRVVLVVPKAIQALMRTLPGVADVLGEETATLPPFDYHCPLLSLPFAFGTTVATVPGPVGYLHADCAPWNDFLDGMSGAQPEGSRLKVGLVWAGRSRTTQPCAAAIDRRRSMPLAEMAPLLDIQRCSFVSLQVGPPASQMQLLPRGATLHDVSARLGDWTDTAALIAGLDLVIAVDTAVAHLAGALGKPVWLLNRFDSCWRWLMHRDDTPWYPTMRQFRQTSQGDWTGVITRVQQALTELAAGTGA